MLKQVRFKCHFCLDSDDLGHRNTETAELYTPCELRDHMVNDCTSCIEQLQDIKAALGQTSVAFPPCTDCNYTMYPGH